MKKTNRIFTTLIFVFLYAPMLVLIVGSFNEGKSLARFDGFTLEQYAELLPEGTLSNREALQKAIREKGELTNE